MGLEPTRPIGQRILSPLRLPIPPLELINYFKEPKDLFLYVFIITQLHAYYTPLFTFLPQPAPDKAYKISLYARTAVYVARAISRAHTHT